MLRVRPYRFQTRPRILQDDDPGETRNCRGLIQDYFEDAHGVFITRNALEMPGFWETTGTFLDVADGTRTAITRLPHESVLVSERIRDGSGNDIDQSTEAFTDAAAYRLRLHTAILLRHLPANVSRVAAPQENEPGGTPVILHTTAVSGHTAVWSLDQFLWHYRPVAAKDVAELTIR